MSMTRYNARPPRRQSLFSRFRLFAFLPILIFLIPIGWIVGWENSHNEITCSVSDKDRTTKSDGNSSARIYTDDCGVLEVGDDLIQGQLSSADTYASIKPGETYTFRTVGWRLPLISVFPNIVEVSK